MKRRQFITWGSIGATAVLAAPRIGATAVPVAQAGFVREPAR